MTNEMLTIDEILDAFASAGRVLPRAALAQAAERWEEVGPALLAKLDDAIAASEVSEAAADILFFVIFVIAQVGDTRGFQPLCRLATLPDDRIDMILSDGVHECLPGILARLYDGDPAPLRGLIEAEDADEFARDSAFEALAWLTATGRIDIDETARYLRDLYRTLQPQAPSYVWVGWQAAISALALDDLVPLVESAFHDEWVGPEVMGLNHFHKDLDRAKRAAEPKAAFDSPVVDVDRFDDVVAYLSEWAGFQPLEHRGSRKPAIPYSPASMEPVRNPLRDVGRNDPCPCGSGKKFKKCCLV